MRVYQLIWFSRSVGHCQNLPLTVEMIRSAIRSAVAWSIPSASRACHANISGQAISVSTTRCWMPLLPEMPSCQPGLWP